MNTQEKLSSISMPVLIILASIGLGGYAIMQINKPPLFSQTLDVHPTVEQLRDGDDQQINSDNPGEEIDLNDYVVSGKYTIFDFSSEYCPACKHIAPYLVDVTKSRADIAVRSIDINRPDVQGIDWGSPVCKQHHIRFAPYFIIYGPGHKLLAEGRDATAQIEKLINSTSQ